MGSCATLIVRVFFVFCFTVFMQGCFRVPGELTAILEKAAKSNGGCAGCAVTEEDEKTILLPGDVPLVLVWIPSGSFMMGGYPGETGASFNEEPQHAVTLSKGFWMGKYEVTQHQWLAVRNSWPSTAPSTANGVGFSYPAYNISWNQAKNFITSLNQHIGTTGQGPLTVRLPSEVEWEYACRAGTETRYYWGDDAEDTLIGEYAWHIGNNTPKGAKPVGGKKPNAYGLFDMSGNVWEWCEDDYFGNYEGAPAFGAARVFAPRYPNRVRRGGDRNAPAIACRSATRAFENPNYAFPDIGFRLAAD